jgi:hypothetical protein
MNLFVKPLHFAKVRSNNYSHLCALKSQISYCTQNYKQLWQWMHSLIPSARTIRVNRTPKERTMQDKILQCFRPLYDLCPAITTLYVFYSCDIHCLHIQTFCSFFIILCRCRVSPPQLVVGSEIHCTKCPWIECTES